MPFCTQCGANVTGTFCSQCGTPVSASAAPPPPAAAAPYAPPVAPGPRRTSPIVWILVIVLGLFLLGGVTVVGVMAYVAHRVHQAGVSFDRGHDGGFSIQTRGSDGKNATVEFGTNGKLPSWIPVYPGSGEHATFTMRGTADGGGEGGNFTFTTPDDSAKVKAYYIDKCKGMGMKVDLDTTTPDGGMIVAEDEGGKGRSLTVILGGHTGETTVNVTYGRK